MCNNSKLNNRFLISKDLFFEDMLKRKSGKFKEKRRNKKIKQKIKNKIRFGDFDEI